MNKKLLEVIKEQKLHPISYIKKGNVYIVSEKDHRYAIKLNTNNYDIYKYLISRDFLDFPENYNHQNDSYDILEYIEEIKINDDQKLNDLIDELALLHKKTSYMRGIDLDELKRNYEEIHNNILDSKEYFYQINDMIDNEMFLSPSMYLLVRNISLIYYLLEYSNQALDKWYQKIKNEKSIRYALLHNNISVNHLIINNNKYLISWDKAYFDNPIYDIENFYRKYYEILDLGEVIHLYENRNKLTGLEKDLLLIRLAVPGKFTLSKNTFFDTEIINQKLAFLQKIYNEIKKQEKIMKT